MDADSSILDHATATWAATSSSAVVAEMIREVSHGMLSTRRETINLVEEGGVIPTDLNLGDTMMIEAEVGYFHLLFKFISLLYECRLSACLGSILLYRTTIHSCSQLRHVETLKTCFA
jgi:hypothetical protein